MIELGLKISPDINRAVRALAATLIKRQLPGVTDVVPAFASVALYYRPEALAGFSPDASPYELLSAQVQAIVAEGISDTTGEPRTIDIPVCYEGEFAPDLDEVAALCELSRERVIELHCASAHFVYMLGFAPGFAYIGGLDKHLTVPRRTTPRTRIPAGSVAIADNQSGIYPLQLPGGWNVIGRTTLKMFDPNRDAPCLLQPGDRVRFVAISSDEFQRMVKARS